MAERHPVETTYKGKRYSGEWWVEDGLLHVRSEFGSASGPLYGSGAARPRRPAPQMPLPSDTAEGMLWDLLRKRDPKRLFFYWR